MGRLYLVSTPIGNLGDITERAKTTLGQVDLIACEDTRKTGLLLQRLGIKIKPKLISYYEENEPRRIPFIIKQLQAGQDIALVANAGTPTISDPGFKLVRECFKNKIKVEAIPGASSVLAALVVSGLPTDKFLFLGYLPKKQGKRKKLLNQLTLINRSIGVTIIMFESPYRLLKTLQDIKDELGEIEIVISQELTKLHESIRREKVSQAIAFFEKKKPRGELTLLFNLSAIRQPQYFQKEAGSLTNGV